MKLGSIEHKELFCRSFLDSHLEYEPENLPWPNLNEADLARLQAIPFWEKALDIEREAGAMVSSYAATVTDPLLHEAIALQGREESRHARLIKTLIDRYSINMPERPPVVLPPKIEPAFTTFGFEECLDSFFAFGLFGIARDAKVFPEALFTIFDPILNEEARHIVFFVNWFTYIQINRRQGFLPLRIVRTLGYYGKALSNLITAFGDADSSGTGFTATGASIFTDDLTLEKFLSVCIQENYQRMSKYDERLLKPELMPKLATIAYRTLQLIPKKRQQHNFKEKTDNIIFD
ncbi:ferritin-like domain-containing protein [Calothrix sp. FACHB-1219]|uniref:ferritin-like domain-containing protein n=1 Tax=unclassified Calothrix TaxID=2619626 RepID=UPI001685845D|nr:MULTISPECIES: ferritin-like domain-containing protein [unclassified Calothrix]MBD2206230.1 ferritin-like domain-containing protein [Calothrix sp. FACHB-168]MBD2219126.1 ferritin-like domain-containing protein [Calothrix sp. FACHB-1219]